MMYICKHRNKDGKPCPESKNGTCSYGVPRYCSSTTKPENAKKFLGFPIINIPEYIDWWLSPVKSFFRSLIRRIDMCYTSSREMPYGLGENIDFNKYCISSEHFGTCPDNLTCEECKEKWEREHQAKKIPKEGV